jgi:hypothetical protein
LKKRLPNCKIDEFYKLLKTRKNEIDEQIYDMLLSFTDFQTFKDMMLDYKACKAGESNFVGLSFNIEKADLKNIHSEDQVNLN